MAAKEDVFAIVQSKLDPKRFREHHWEGSLTEYLEMVAANGVFTNPNPAPISPANAAMAQGEDPE